MDSTISGNKSTMLFFSNGSSSRLNKKTVTKNDKAIISGHYVFSSPEFKILKNEILEKIDEEKNPTIKDFIKSKLFKIQTVQLIQYSAYIVGLTVSLVFIKFSSTTDLLIFWALISLIAQIPSTLIISIWVKKENLIQVNYLTILKYFIALIPTYFVIDFLNNNILDHSTNLFEFIPVVSLILSIGILTYIGTTLLLDFNTRNITKSIFSELKN
jgi:hypothetical protein